MYLSFQYINEKQLFKEQHLSTFRATPFTLPLNCMVNQMALYVATVAWNSLPGVLEYPFNWRMKCNLVICLLNIGHWQKYLILTFCQQWRTGWPEVRSLIRDCRSSCQCAGMLWYPSTLCPMGMRGFCCWCNPQYPERRRSSVTITDFFFWKFTSTPFPLHNQASRHNANYVHLHSLYLVINERVNCKFAKSLIRNVETNFYEILTVNCF